MKCTSNTKSQGFTLIELSIVLVIIGLIVGGVLVGRDLIRQAQFRAVISEVEELKTAIMTFKGKYNGLPGDITDAYEAFDGSGGSNVCGSRTSVIYGCNGNGDGVINPGQTDPLRAWMHMDLAGFISIPDKTIGASNHLLTNPYQVGFNMPASSLDGMGYVMTNNIYTPIYGPGTLKRGNMIMLTGDDYPNTTFHNAMHGHTGWGKSLNGTEAKLLDAKVDDGLARSGKIYGMNGQEFSGAYGCVGVDASGDNGGSYNSPNAVYQTERTENNCYLVFWLE